MDRVRGAEHAERHKRFTAWRSQSCLNTVPPTKTVSPEERANLKLIEEKLDELVEWKNAITELLYGSLRGEFGYFHKSNIIWRILILWPIMISSIGVGAGLTFLIQHWLSSK